MASEVKMYRDSPSIVIPLVYLKLGVRSGLDQRDVHHQTCCGEAHSVPLCFPFYFEGEGGQHGQGLPAQETQSAAAGLRGHGPAAGSQRRPLQRGEDQQRLQQGEDLVCRQQGKGIVTISQLSSKNGINESSRKLNSGSFCCLSVNESK